MTKADDLAAALERFLDVSTDVEAAAVVSGDGLPIASALPPHVEEDRLAAMSAALLTLGERAATGLGKGALGQVYVEGDQGHVVLMAAGDDAVLVTVTSPRAKVGLILFEMRQTARRVIDIMAVEPAADAVAYQPRHGSIIAPVAPAAPEAYYVPPVTDPDPAPVPAAAPVAGEQISPAASFPVERGDLVDRDDLSLDDPLGVDDELGSEDPFERSDRAEPAAPQPPSHNTDPTDDVRPPADGSDSEGLRWH